MLILFLFRQLTERLVDRQVSLDDEHRCTGDLRLLEDDTSPSVQHTIDTTDGSLRTLLEIHILY